MRKYGKWALVAGLMAATPSLGLAAPWSRASEADRADKTAEKAPAATKPTGKNQNQKVADDIAVALRNARLQGYDIEIEYKDGTAILKGRVVDPKQKDKATQVAEKVAGVKSVDNQLVLSPKPSFSDRMRGGVTQAAHESAAGASKRVQPVNFEGAAAPSGNNQAMAEQIAAALTAANLDGYDIEIRYQDGVAVLGGSVGTPMQRAAAERVVAQVPGVMSVQNQLRPMQGPAQAPAGPYGPMMAGPGPQGPVHPAAFQGQRGPGMPAGPQMAPAGYAHGGPGGAPAMYNGPAMPDYAWPSYAQYPNSAAVTYPQQYSASAFPYIGPFYPYPQVPLGWRDATLRWDDGQWNLQFRQRTDKWWWFLAPKNW